MTLPRDPPTRRSSRRRLTTLIVIALAAGLGTLGLTRLGSLLAVPDPLQKADAVYVLGGSIVDRSVEALYLYREGYAPRILLSPEGREAGELALEREGVNLPSRPELVRDLLIGRLGVPATAVEVLPGHLDNTAQEADAIRPYVDAGHWRRLIVITSCATTRRARYTLHRSLGARVDVIMRCSRYDPYDAQGWWKTRTDFRATFYETPKLLAYWLGLKG